MKKFICMIFVASLFLIGCGDKKNDPNNGKDSTDIILDISEEDLPKQIFDLVYRLNENKKFTYSLKTITKNLQKIVSDTTISMEINQSVNYTIDVLVKEIGDDKIAEIEMNIKSVDMLMKSPDGQTVSFNSKKDTSKESQMKFLDFFAMINSPFRVRLTTKGEIIEITRVDKILNKMLSLQNIPDTIAVEQKNQIVESLKLGAIKPLVEKLFRELPQEKVGIDSTWQDYLEIGSGQTKPAITFKIENYEKKESEILTKIIASLSVTLSNPQDSFTDKGVNYKLSKPKVTGSGSIYFNINKGLIQKSETTVQTEQTMTMTPEGQPNSPYKATRTDKTTNTVIVELL
ncbi:MAG: hypothetical protein JXA68_12155 [Ignavibacteriales bacterium]|nr:hypothetical protein [Ignavibacteriales bacterium]